MHKTLRMFVGDFKRWFYKLSIKKAKEDRKVQRKLHGQLICETKLVFATKRRAWNWAMEFYKIKGIWHGVYKCGYCEHYHLTQKTRMPPPKDIIKASSS